ncbi:hypothetical protein [uncultured Litoreibacter sp.]|uniref:hypothetical protein n=1 Tax=uncultured Litoreibacter sp. TaxID=1392394 RepID=UPI00262F940D|nr:hypothetical protein [uncultured Litoreibacter sp.]
MRFFLLALTACIAACSTPGVEVWGGTNSRQSVGAYSFTVNHTRTRAEAYRTNFALRPPRAEVFASAALAMELASGCKAVRGSLSGDVALIKADLIC